MSPRPTLAIATAAVLVAVVLAGCSSGGERRPTGGVDTGRIDQTILPTGDEVAGDAQVTDGGKAEAAPGNGEIRGTVKDDAGLPVEDALVSLIGTEDSAVTDVQGAFRFANVTSGDHTLRITPGEVFRVHEGVVDVEAGRVTLVTITLVPVDGRGPGYRPHLHDYWGDKTEIVLFDTALDWGKAGFPGYGPAGDALSRSYSANAGTYLYFRIPERDDGLPAIVVPGTAQVRFTIAWDESEVDVDRFVLGFQPGDNKYREQPPATNGAEATVDIDAEDADNGHQGFSLWGFRIKPEARTPPVTILGLIHIKAILVKGHVPVDPPHEDFWGANATSLVRTWDTPATVASNCCADTHVTALPDPKRLVPPGTGSLDIRMGFMLTRAPGTPADLTWELLAKPADLRPDAPLSAYLALTPASESANLKVYNVPIAATQTDAYYQVDSNWVFVIRQDGEDLPFAMAEAEHRFNLEIIANKDPAYV